MLLTYIRLPILSPSHILLLDRKAGTAVATAWTAWYSIFIIDYGPQQHVLSDLQRWYRNKLDGLLGINAGAAKQISNQSGDSNK